MMQLITLAVLVVLAIRTTGTIKAYKRMKALETIVETIG